jgi:hypothetical protein
MQRPSENYTYKQRALGAPATSQQVDAFVVVVVVVVVVVALFNV